MGAGYYAIYEVYYNDGGKPYMLTEDAVAVSGESLEDLREGYDQMRQAFGAPVLDYDKDFPGDRSNEKEIIHRG